MRRIMIVGGSGAGKTTLALLVAARTGLAPHHLDRLQMLPGRKQRPDEDKRRDFVAITQMDGWIVEGNNQAALTGFLGHADTVLWLDVNIWIRLWRIWRRPAQVAGRKRPDLPDGCSDGSIYQTARFMLRVWRNRYRMRQRRTALLKAALPGTVVMRLVTNLDIQAFLDKLPK
jgi:adenylate kinase family enzyme